jgi:hypothetical protein
MMYDNALLSNVEKRETEEIERGSSNSLFCPLTDWINETAIWSSLLIMQILLLLSIIIYLPHGHHVRGGGMSACISVGVTQKTMRVTSSQESVQTLARAHKQFLLSARRA